MRDFQRARLYRAECEAFEPRPWAKELSLEECRQLVKKAAKFTCGPIPEVVDGRGRRHACGGAYRIALPRHFRIINIVLHEYTHAITRDGHGREFARNYLRLVRRFMGKDVANTLKESFRLLGVKYRRSSWAK